MGHQITCAWCNAVFVTSGRRDTKYCSSRCQLKNKDSKKDRTVYYQANKVSLLEKRKERYKLEKLKPNFKENVREYHRVYSKNRMTYDINYKLTKRLRTRLYSAIKLNSKVGSAIGDLGCSVEELKKYLESKFLPGMSWDNWGMGANAWQIDHIKRLSDFNLANPIAFKEACHYTNLQPLWWEDHLTKSAQENT